jgi:hypothetical protein
MQIDLSLKSNWTSEVTNSAVNGVGVKLERKPMELLIFLVAGREQLILRKEIVAKRRPSDLFVNPETNINIFF